MKMYARDALFCSRNWNICGIPETEHTEYLSILYIIIDFFRLLWYNMLIYNACAVLRDTIQSERLPVAAADLRAKTDLQYYMEKGILFR